MTLNLSHRTLYPMEDNDTDGLPLDPFEMGITATITAIAGWCEEQDRLNIMRNRTLALQIDSGNKEVYERSNSSYGFDGNIGESRKGSRQDGYAVICNPEKFLSFKSEIFHVVSPQIKESVKGSGICHGADEGAPNEALLFALGYLGVHDLLAVERVCRSLRSAIQSDVLLWKTIHIDPQLSQRITDDALLSLTNRAQGNLQCLSLVGCTKITNSGLKSVLERNPRLSKLNVAECSKDLVGGIVDNLKAFKNISASGINHLRFGLCYGVSRKQFEELKLLVGEDKCMQQAKATTNKKPRYYHYEHLYAFGDGDDDDERAIDIEICPRCPNVRPVYDCPIESCQKEQSCRACKFCIKRCVRCGRCVDNIEYEEIFDLHYLCCYCVKKRQTRYWIQVWG